MFDFIFEFFRNVLIQPDEFAVDRSNLQIANFSFDNGHRKVKMKKFQYIRDAILHFLLSQQNYLKEFRLDEDFLEIIELYESKNQEQFGSPKSDKNIDANAAGEKTPNLIKSGRQILKDEVSKQESSDLGIQSKGTLKECLVGINALIPDETMGSAKPQFEGNENIHDIINKMDRNANVFLNDDQSRSDGSQIASQKVIF